MRKKNSLALMFTMLLLLCACGADNSVDNSVELTNQNIGEYLHVEVNSEQISGVNPWRPLLTNIKQTVKIYPVQGGSFNNVVLYIYMPGSNDDWELLGDDPNIEQCKDESSRWYGLTYLKIDLPANGNYTATYSYESLDGLSEIPGSKQTDYFFKDEGFTAGQIQAFIGRYLWIIHPCEKSPFYHFPEVLQENFSLSHFLILLYHKNFFQTNPAQEPHKSNRTQHFKQL